VFVNFKEVLFYDFPDRADQDIKITSVLSSF